MWKRLVNIWRALINALLDKVEDPNMLIDQWKRDQADLLEKNRELAVKAITSKNNLQAQLDSAIAKSKQLEAQAALALKLAATQPTPELAKAKNDVAAVIMREKLSNDQTITALTESLAQASATCESVKKAIQNSETEFKKKCAESLVLKAKYSAAQAQNAISKALGDMEFESSNEGFARAQEMVTSKVSEAAARDEMGETSINSKIAEVANAQIDVEAEDALAQLAKNLGLAAPATTTITNTLSSEAISAENALQNRIGTAV